MATDREDTATQDQVDAERMTEDETKRFREMLSLVATDPPRLPATGADLHRQGDALMCHLGAVQMLTTGHLAKAIGDAPLDRERLAMAYLEQGARMLQLATLMGVTVVPSGISSAGRVQ